MVAIALAAPIVATATLNIVMASLVTTEAEQVVFESLTVRLGRSALPARQ